MAACRPYALAVRDGHRAAWALVVGGALQAALYVPFTLAHGPSSVNEERAVLGADMHVWGLFLGVVPTVLLGAGVWLLRDRLAGGRRVADLGCAAVAVVLWASAALDLAFWALGPPFGLLVLAPALGVVAVTTRASPPLVRTFLRTLAGVLLVAAALALVPDGPDAYGVGYRVFGTLAYAASGLLWAGLGLAVQRPPAA